jgi:hypothetical protein
LIKCEIPKVVFWINKNGYKSAVLMMIGTLQKEQKFYHIQKFPQSNAANTMILDTCSDKECPLYAQILTATAGTANSGIDDLLESTQASFCPSYLM